MLKGLLVRNCCVCRTSSPPDALLITARVYYMRPTYCYFCRFGHSFCSHGTILLTCQLSAWQTKFMAKLAAEREATLRLKGENGIMKNKFSRLSKWVKVKVVANTQTPCLCLSFVTDVLAYYLVNWRRSGWGCMLTFRKQILPDVVTEPFIFDSWCYTHLLRMSTAYLLALSSVVPPSTVWYHDIICIM